jgi:heme A synthase
VALSLSNPYLIAVHYALAMFLLATLVIANVRVGNLGARYVQPGDASGRTFRSSRAGAGLAFVVVVFGALVANIPGAAASCQGFPACRSVLLGGLPLGLHITHRVLALFLFCHLFAVAYLTKRRHEGRTIVLATRWVFYAVVLQVIVAATMVELHLPAPLQSLHQALGTLVWVAAVTSAALAGRGVAERQTETVSVDAQAVIA